MSHKFLCFRSKDPEKKASKKIDKKLKNWMKNYNKVIKLLLLGAGESGKTTILKQMRILHEQGFTEEERYIKAQWIRRNLLESMKEIVDAMDILVPPVKLEDDNNKLSLEFVQQMESIEVLDYKYGYDFYQHIQNLWLDKGIQACYQRSNEYNLIDSAKYFFDKIDEISSDNYLPSDQDILHCRRRTMDLQRIEFEVKVPTKYGGGNQVFWMFDVGGQRGERRKWIQVFDGITAVLFIVASSGFDLKIREENKTNRLREALKLFEDVWNSRFLSNSAFILFLNKQDILQEKINRGIRLEDYFPDYREYKKQISCYDEADYEYFRAREFIKDKFLAKTKSKKSMDRSKSIDAGYGSALTINQRGHEIFWHYTTATDTNNINKVFHDIHTMIVLSNLKKISIN
ncbi:guanine nucleotide-binding protein G(s) subunit alpha-like [Brevipalpus obovatus]|uniref:guanine nucleotide-binding protein G(s) subunit alpha-like n=1 Tax=Brevipalpus obovatus TaxID=246614 RepID=UPI003D9E1E8B